MTVSGASDGVMTPDEVEKIENLPTKAEMEVARLAHSIEDGPARSANTDRKVICYNSGCADYRVERPWDVSCSCKRKRVQGAGR